jgi:hypothetical protein
MACILCPGVSTSAKRPASGGGSRAHTFRVRVENATQEADYRTKYSDYRAQRQVISANSVVLIFTRT